MNADKFGFKAVGRPLQQHGRVVGNSDTQAAPTMQKADNSELLAAVKEYMETPVQVMSFSNGVGNLPYQRKKNITMLEGIKLYLQAQLASVNVTLEKLKAEVDNAQEAQD